MSTPATKTTPTTPEIPGPRLAPDLVDDQKTSPGHRLSNPSHRVLDLDLQLFASPRAAAARVLEHARHRAGGTGVFTCNVDHVMLMNDNAEFRLAYQRADVVTIDGAPLALLSRWTGCVTACRVTGVDLTVALVEVAAAERLTVALVGGAPGRATAAARRLHQMFPALSEVVVDSPRMGFALGDHEDDRLISSLVSQAPDVVIVCLGAPKQELWIDRHRHELPGAVIVGAGATIDVLAGVQPRAPKIFRRTGTEAAFRLVTDFRRLWRRYLVRDVRFVGTFTSLVLAHRSRSVRLVAANRPRWHSRPVRRATGLSTPTPRG